MKARALVLSFACAAAAGIASAATDDLSTASTGRAAFTQPFGFIESTAPSRFKSGGDLFRLPWFAQSEAQGRFGGLGPLSNRFSCEGCHIGNGRGQTSSGEGDVMRSTLLRLSVPGQGPHGAPLPDPIYGEQLQPTGIYGVLGEGEASLGWHETDRMLPDGTRVVLRAPELVLSRLHYGPLAKDVMTSVRMSPAVFGLGLLEAVPDEELMALAEAQARNGEGVRGRLNHVWNVEKARVETGRFGLKANQPDLRQQVAGALSGDMGITSRLFMAQNCTPAEDACAKAPAGRSPEIDDSDLAALVAYVEALAPPARRDGGEAAARGEMLFAKIGCAACHAPELTTGANAAFPQISGRTIHPYTDLLLHDMGEGLADGRPDFEAGPRDWRTTPLWGIGLAPQILERPAYLHDGRARSLTEAILWHGGEAAHARDGFAALNENDRGAVLAFLGSL